MSMQEWRAVRSSREAASFVPALTGLGIDSRAWDSIAPEIEHVLCGVSSALLDQVYPARVDNLRIYLTAELANLPALRVAFKLDTDGAILYLAVDRRGSVANE